MKKLVEEENNNNNRNINFGGIKGDDLSDWGSLGNVSNNNSNKNSGNNNNKNLYQNDNIL